MQGCLAKPRPENGGVRQDFVLRHRRDMQDHARTPRMRARKAVASTTAAASLSGPSLTSAASSSLLLPSPPHLIGRPLLLPGSVPASLPPLPWPSAPDRACGGRLQHCPGIARETTANRSSVLRRCKRKGPLTPGTATAAPGAATQSPERPGAAAASAYASCHSTEYYRLPQQCTLMTAFMCYACYAMDMTWSCNIIRRVLGTLS